MTLAVCIASFRRPLRLRWLLNALDTPAEVVVAHAGDPETAALVRSHAAVARDVPLAAPFTPGRARNAAWRLSSADLVAFTDDDCRPAPGWLAALGAAAAPDAVLQGTTRPDPDELGRTAVRGWRTQDITPPTPWGQACNIAYPRALLERLGGFDEALPGGEDCDLLQRALAAGARQVAVPGALVWHAVEVHGLPARLRRAQRWRALPEVVRRHPHLRRHLPLRVFWTPRHAWLAAAVLAPRPLRPLVALGYGRAALPAYGPGLRGRLRAVAELPLQELEDWAEVAALARGSLAARTLLL